MNHKSGFVNIIGKPNVGKSTLLNALVGEKISAVTYKAQTTRHRILGIVSTDDYQIVYSDTPGILDPAYKLHESMMKYVETSLEDADVFLYMVEAGERNPPLNIIQRIKESGIPIILLINKIDKIKPEQLGEEMSFWKEYFPQADILPISALYSSQLPELVNKVVELLPENPPYFPKDEITDRTTRFIVSEIIREKIFLNYRKEVPYHSEVVVDSFKEDDNFIRIRAVIYVARESQKMIIIGKNGEAIKKMGIEARKDIEDFVGRKVYLELSVKIAENWRNDPRMLRRLGYEL
ncbi:MAG TPA: GTPase Era [Bacteroidales bacterium]|jgi:GTP-binding protein Era|nr:GTPase Era [Bacteroidales bacterium]MDI9574011.1 GTPase Era [Bacteroidota bacterium]OQC59761.1 MAG: GTPase Era [Bacteroidetes bacterium ADurb.Bin012]MBP9512334.1 GTPase Era [Bacteroidales bacterium]MBP9588965.1 GTPase Era [Bacteroidales bacterium]